MRWTPSTHSVPFDEPSEEAWVRQSLAAAIEAPKPANSKRSVRSARRGEGT